MTFQSLSADKRIQDISGLIGPTPKSTTTTTTTTREKARDTGEGSQGVSGGASINNVGPIGPIPFSFVPYLMPTLGAVQEAKNVKQKSPQPFSVDMRISGGAYVFS